MPKNIEEEIKQLVTQITDIPVKNLKPEADFFNELGIDSMKAIEIMAAFEKKYKVIIPEEEIPLMRSLGKIVEFAKKKVK